MLFWSYLKGRMRTRGEWGRSPKNSRQRKITIEKLQFRKCSKIKASQQPNNPTTQQEDTSLMGGVGLSVLRCAYNRSRRKIWGVSNYYYVRLCGGIFGAPRIVRNERILNCTYYMLRIIPMFAFEVCMSELRIIQYLMSTHSSVFPTNNSKVRVRYSDCLHRTAAAAQTDDSNETNFPTDDCDTSKACYTLRDASLHDVLSLYLSWFSLAV